VITLSQRPLPGNTQHSQQTDIHAPVGLGPTVSADKRPQTYAVDMGPVVCLRTKQYRQILLTVYETLHIYIQPFTMELF